MKNISPALSCATCTLLGLATPPAISAAEPWDIDLGLMNYIEQDRNTGIEFLVNARRELANGDEVTLGVEIDTLTGATPQRCNLDQRRANLHAILGKRQLLGRCQPVTG